MKTLFTLFALLPFLAQAQLTFDALRKELNAPPDASKISCDFAFENKTDKDIEIARFESTCSCISAQIGNGGKLKYAPGEKGVIRANFDMQNYAGKVDKLVNVWIKGDPDDKPSLNLVVVVNIPVLVELSPKTAEWSLTEKMEPKTIKIKMNHSEPIKITSTSVSNPIFTAELKTITEGKEYDLIVTPVGKLDNKAGIGMIHIETDCKIAKQRKQIAFAIVRNAPVTSSVAGDAQLGPAPVAPEGSVK
jgi:hypothetical protein